MLCAQVPTRALTAYRKSIMLHTHRTQLHLIGLRNEILATLHAVEVGGGVPNFGDADGFALQTPGTLTRHKSSPFLVHRLHQQWIHKFSSHLPSDRESRIGVAWISTLGFLEGPSKLCLVCVYSRRAGPIRRLRGWCLEVICASNSSKADCLLASVPKVSQVDCLSTQLSAPLSQSGD